MISLSRLLSPQCGVRWWLSAIAAHALLPMAAQENWPQFRGPGARGVGDSDKLPLVWGSGTNIAWQTPIPGRGWSSPVVWGQRIFVTTVISEGQVEAPKKGLYFGGERPDPPSHRHSTLLAIPIPKGGTGNPKGLSEAMVTDRPPRGRSN